MNKKKFENLKKKPHLKYRSVFGERFKKTNKLSLKGTRISACEHSCTKAGYFHKKKANVNSRLYIHFFLGNETQQTRDGEYLKHLPFKHFLPFDVLNGLNELPKFS